jgi:plastocyanin
MGHDMAMSSPKRKALPVLAANQIGIDNFSFTPRVLSVARGTSVTWINSDDVPHIIASKTGNFPGSKVIDTDQRFSYAFGKPGTYDYFCAIHPTMQGSVVVQ